MIYALDGLAAEIGPDAWVADTAVLIGRVVIEPEASIWFGAVLRGDNEEIRVGRGSNAVSYTHLDVYKRQDRCGWWNRSSDRRRYWPDPRRDPRR